MNLQKLVFHYKPCETKFLKIMAASLMVIISVIENNVFNGCILS